MGYNILYTVYMYSIWQPATGQWHGNSL